MEEELTMDNENQKKGHGTLAIILGIVGIIVALFIGILFGLYGVVPALVLASLAIILGIISLKNTHGRSGKGGIILGIIAVLLSAAVYGISAAVGAFLASDEIKQNVPILSEYADESWRGIAGVMAKMADDGVDMDEVSAQIDAYQAKTKGTQAATE